jgi:hypothetical protein
MYRSNADASKELPMQGILPNPKCPHCVNPHDIPHAKHELPRISIFVELLVLLFGVALAVTPGLAETGAGRFADLVAQIVGVVLIVVTTLLLKRDLTVLWHWLNGVPVQYYVDEHGHEHVHERFTSASAQRNAALDGSCFTFWIGRQQEGREVRYYSSYRSSLVPVFLDPQGRIEIVEDFGGAHSDSRLILTPKEAFELMHNCASLKQVRSGKGIKVLELERSFNHHNHGLLGSGVDLDAVLWKFADVLWVTGKPGPNAHWKKRVQAIRQQFWYLAGWMFSAEELKARIRTLKDLRKSDRDTYGEHFDVCPNCSTDNNTVFMMRKTFPDATVRPASKPEYVCMYCKHTTRPTKD